MTKHTCLAQTPAHNCVAAVHYLAKDATQVATTAKHRLRKITLNIESRQSLKHAEKRFDLKVNSKYVSMVVFICAF